MPGVAAAQAFAIRHLIAQQPKEQQEILTKLLTLQEDYKFAWFWNKAKARKAIDEYYPKHIKEVKILQNLYLQTL